MIKLARRAAIAANPPDFYANLLSTASKLVWRRLSPPRSKFLKNQRLFCKNLSGIQARLHAIWY
jgi:hypothetical protein